MERGSDKGTLLMAEGRQMMRLANELGRETFEALLAEYRRLLRDVLEEAGARDLGGSGDTVTAVFASTGEAALAAAAAQHAVASHVWPHGRSQAMSVGLHSAADANAIDVCSDLCDAAEGGQIFASEATAELLAGEDLGNLSVVDGGEVTTRRTQRVFRAFELVEKPS